MLRQEKRSAVASFWAALDESGLYRPCLENPVKPAWKPALSRSETAMTQLRLLQAELDLLLCPGSENLRTGLQMCRTVKLQLQH